MDFWLVKLRVKVAFFVVLLHYRFYNFYYFDFNIRKIEFYYDQKFNEKSFYLKPGDSKS